MDNQRVSFSQVDQSVLATNNVLRNTYILLSLTLLFGAACAGLAMVTNAPPLGFMSILIYFGLLFVAQALSESPWGILAVFAFTGFLGFTIGPIINLYLHGMTNGAQLVMTSLAGTGIIFFALSGYVLTTRQNFSYLGGFLVVGVMLAFMAGIASMFFQLPALSLAVSAAFILLSSGLIMYETSEIIHGGQRNYILATITLYVSIYNLFLSLLQLLSFFSNRD